MIRQTREKTRDIADRWERFKLRYYEWLKGSDRRVAVLVWLFFSAAAAYLTIPETALSFLPTSDSDVGRIMKFNARADRDYEIVDEEGTARDREAAMAKVLHYYHYRTNAPHYKKLRDAFSTMRGRAVSVLLDKTEPGDPALPKDFDPLRRVALEKNLSWLVTDALRGDVLLAIDKGKKDFERSMGRELNDELFAELRSAYFSQEIEDALFSILDRLENHYILREGLAPDYEPDRIAIQRGESVFQRLRSRVVSEKTLWPEIVHLQRQLKQNTFLNERGLAIVTAIAYELVENNIIPDEVTTEKNRDAAARETPPVLIRVKNGEIVARAGEIVTKRQVSIFRELVEKKNEKPLLIIFIEHFIFILFALAVTFLSFRRSVSKFSARNKDLLLMGTLAFFVILLIYGIVSVSVPFSQWMGNVDSRVFYFLLPFPFVVATVRLLVNTETALFFIIALMVLFTNIFPDNYYFPAYYTIGALFYLYLITHIDRRSHILRVSLSLAGLQFLLAILIFLMDTTLPMENLLRGLLLAFASGIFSALLLMGLIPLWEAFFAYTTDITYLELTSMQHPLMARLVTEANGSYQHSLMVGVMVEDAARRIRVNPLACKVMAYYHDIGKLNGPRYYSENQAGENIHDSMEPIESVQILFDHVRYGLELARSHKLGEKIEEAILLHHGTSLAMFFYELAKQRDPATPEALYRYPGPKPRSKDVGLIMLADSTEAAIRSMKEKNYEKIREGVGNIIDRKMQDGQLADCNMTMRDISLIKESFIKTLAGQYHARVEYQQPVA